MSVYVIVVLILIAIFLTAAVMALIFDHEMMYLRRENQMLRRLFSEQAKLHQMSLDAYIAMLRGAQRNQIFNR